MKISLSSGLTLDDAEMMLDRKFDLWPFENYDGQVPANPDVIQGEDIKYVFKLGMRGSPRPFQNAIQIHGRSITEFLLKIPKGQMIEDVDLEKYKAPIIGIFEIFMGTKGIKQAGATKLLYRFRPGLFVVIDSIVDGYYWWSSSINDQAAFHQLKRTKGGAYLFEMMKLIQKDVQSCRKDIDKLLLSCLGKPYADIPRARAIESLIWFYYARGGPPAIQ